MSIIQLNFDGGARNNPGPAGAGGVIKKDGQIIKKYYRYLGEKTNNQAEYLAALLGVRIINRLDIEIDQLIIIGDSSLVIEQLAGNFKVKNQFLKELYDKVKQELSDLEGKVIYRHVKRDKNELADFLVNKAIKEEQKKNRKNKT